MPRGLEYDLNCFRLNNANGGATKEDPGVYLTWSEIVRYFIVCGKCIPINLRSCCKALIRMRRAFLLFGFFGIPYLEDFFGFFAHLYFLRVPAILESSIAIV